MIAGAARASRDSTPSHLDPIRHALAFAACVLVFMLAGCSSQNFTPTPTPLPATSYYAPPRQIYGTSHTEVASWYGPGFAGRRTSTGEIYNPSGLTAASTTLPLGSHVRVTNPETGRSVVVRINDRGPFVRGRSLDLSHGAAQQIGLTGRGVGRVRVTPTAAARRPSVRSRRPTARAPSPNLTQCARRLVLVTADTRHSQTPSLSLHFIAANRLKSDRRVASKRIRNDQYRVTFRWESGHAYEVCVEDYH